MEILARISGLKMNTKVEQIKYMYSMNHGHGMDTNRSGLHAM